MKSSPNEEWEDTDTDNVLENIAVITRIQAVSEKQNIKTLEVPKDEFDKLRPEEMRYGQKEQSLWK